MIKLRFNKIINDLLDTERGGFKSTDIINATRLLQSASSYGIKNTAELEQLIDTCRIDYLHNHFNKF